MPSEPVQIALLGLLSEVVKGWASVGAAAVQALSWPVFLGIALVTMRSPLSRLIDRFKALGFGEFKAELFERRLQEAETLGVKSEAILPSPVAQAQQKPEYPATTEPAQESTQPESTPSHESLVWRPTRGPRARTFEEILEISPSLAIDNIWMDIKVQLSALRDKFGSRDLSDEDLLFALFSAGLVNKDVIALFRQLSELRTQAIRKPDLSDSDAIRFRNASEGLAVRLRNVSHFLQRTNPASATSNDHTQSVANPPSENRPLIAMVRAAARTMTRAVPITVTRSP